MLEKLLSELKIMEINELLTHEQIIPVNLLRLKEAMLNIGQLVDPLIVDGKTKVILDGNHRIKVLEIIKCPRAVCQIVDYSSPQVTVGTWMPVSNSLDVEKVKNNGFRTERVDFNTGLKALENKKAPFLLVRKKEKIKECHLINPSDYSLDGMIDEQKAVISKLNDNSFSYIADDMVDECMDAGKAVLFRKIYTKQEIIARAQAKNPFPPKSTRHIIPNRVIRLNMRLGWLHEGEKEARAYLERALRERVYNGNVRRYVEPVIVIY